MYMFRWLNLLLLLLLSFVNNSGNNTEHVTGIKGENITLSCEFEANQIRQIDLIRESGVIYDWTPGQENCTGRVCKEGSCDVVIKDLIYSDAWKYFLRVYYNDPQVPGPGKERIYQLQILEKISVKTGEELNLKFLLAYGKVEKNTSEGWKEIHGENLIIKEFTHADTGTYRVLDSNNEILITVSVTVTESKGKLDTDHKTNVTEQPPVENGISQGILVSVIVIVIVIVIVAVTVILCRRRRGDHVPVQQEDRENPAVLGNL